MATTSAIPYPVKNQALRVYWRIYDKATGEVYNGGLTSLSATISKDGGNYAATTSSPVEIQTSGTGYLELSSTECNCSCALVKVSAGDEYAMDATLDPIYFHDLSEPSDHWLDATVIRLEQGVVNLSVKWLNKQARNQSNGVVRFFDKSDATLYNQTYTANLNLDGDGQMWSVRSKFGT